MSKKVLVIEDEYQFIEAYKVVFSKENIEVIVANNGRVGLEMAKNEKPDVILLDLVMPEMDGYTFLEHVKSMPDIQKIPIYVLSSLPKSAIENSVPHEIIKGILSKADYTPKKILGVIKEYLK